MNGRLCELVVCSFWYLHSNEVSPILVLSTSKPKLYHYLQRIIPGIVISTFSIFLIDSHWNVTDREIRQILLSRLSIWELVVNVHLHGANNAEHRAFIYWDWNSLLFPLKCLCVHYTFLQHKWSLYTLPSALLTSISAQEKRSFGQKWYIKICFKTIECMPLQLRSHQW